MSKPERLVEEMESIAGELEEHLDSLRFVGRTVSSAVLIPHLSFY
jgi:hypothetical protein